MSCNATRGIPADSEVQKLLTSTERTLSIETRSGKQFLVKESGEIRALDNNAACGLMIGLLHRPGDKLTLLTKVFSMFDELPAEELLRQVASCMNKPNKWLVIANVNGKPVVWPDEEAVNGLRVQRRKTLTAQAR